MEMICINNYIRDKVLTIGKSYRILGGTYPHLVLLYDDNNDLRNYPKDCFASIKEYRKLKLKNINESSLYK